ncbi:MAG TPA: MBL fold metallo-hydrolase [Acidimicrobiales bacterium]|jgi:glyoxylase-like metal-dependent hydrolase (beta-lactamase superfamily II)|nr:MBL fold metallo-hydrolase [Acidimicrobiales bacterium]
MLIGDISLEPVSDGVCRLPPAFYVGLDWSTHADLLTPDGFLEIPIGCFLMRSGDRVVLLDAGLGARSDVDWAVGGLLPAALASAGVSAADIDTVVCTHLHLDHVGWLVVDGQPYFPNADVRFGLADWSVFVDSPRADPAVAAAMRLLDSQGRLSPIEGDDVSLAPGLTARHTPGHTPGHYGLVVSSGEERAVLLGDAVECPLQLDEPDFYAISDVDPELGRRTREALWRELEGTNALVGAAHFPGLEFGRVLTGAGTRWFPLS